MREKLSLVEDYRPVALVTGSTSGIGESVARRFVEEGYNVILHSRSSENKGRSLAAELKSASYIQADLAQESDRIRLIHDAVGLWGRLDVLVNNAGLSGVIPHADLRAATSEIWHALYEVNVVAPFHLIAEAETALRNAAEQGRAACIVNISSRGSAAQRGLNSVCSHQGGAQPRDTATCSVTGADHQGQCRCAWPCRYTANSRLDSSPRVMANARADATASQPGRHCASCHDVRAIGLFDGRDFALRWWTQSHVIETGKIEHPGNTQTAGPRTIIANRSHSPELCELLSPPSRRQTAWREWPADQPASAIKVVAHPMIILRVDGVRDGPILLGHGR